MTNNIITTITTEYGVSTYELPYEVAMAVTRMITPYYKSGESVATPKAEPKAETKVETKAETKRVKVYALCEDGKSVTIGGDGFIPTKVFKGVTYSLKQSGAKYDAKTKVWAFETKKACTEWCKEQDKRA